MGSTGHLIVINGKRSGELLPIHDRMSLGRGRSVDVRFLDRSVSRKHLAIAEDGGAFRVEDLGSSCGTFVNGQRISSAHLKDGDKLQIGETLLEFRSGLPRATRESAAVRFVTDTPVPEPSIQRVVDIDRLGWVQTADRKAAPRVVDALAMMYRIGNLLAAEREVHAVYRLVMDSLFEVLEADRGFLILQEEVDDTLRTVCARQGMQPSGEPLQSEITVSRTIVDDCIQRGVSVITSDAMFDERYKEGASVQLHNIRSVLCVPLRGQEMILGAIYIDSLATTGVFKEFDLELATAISTQGAIAIERHRLTQAVEETFMGTVRALVNSIEAKDRYTRGHSERVASLAFQIAQEMGLDPEEQQTLYLAAILHDVGKIGIDGQILKKTDRLTTEEYEIIKTHPTIGAEILSGIPNVERIIWIVEHHHERWDGSGFPDGIARDEISLPTRILSLADAFDAMTTKRPYRPAMSNEQALAELRRCADRFFDPAVVDAFESIVQDGRLQPLHTIFPGKRLPNPSKLVRGRQPVSRGAETEVYNLDSVSDLDLPE